MRKITIALLLALMTMPAAAREGGYIQGFYSLADAGDLGINDGTVTSGSLTISQSSDDEGNAIGLAGGYLFDNGLGIEAGFARFNDFGVDATLTASNAVVGGDTLDGTISTSQDIEGDMFYLAPVAYLDLSPVMLKAKIGAAYFDVENQSTVSGSGTVNGSAISGSVTLDAISESGTSLLLGLGAEYALTENVSAMVEYMRIQDVGGGELSETDIDTLNFALVYYIE